MSIPNTSSVNYKWQTNTLIIQLQFRTISLMNNIWKANFWWLRIKRGGHEMKIIIILLYFVLCVVDRRSHKYGSFYDDGKTIKKENRKKNENRNHWMCDEIERRKKNTKRNGQRQIWQRMNTEKKENLKEKRWVKRSKRKLEYRIRVFLSMILFLDEAEKKKLWCFCNKLFISYLSFRLSTLVFFSFSIREPETIVRSLFFYRPHHKWYHSIKFLIIFISLCLCIVVDKYK